MRGPNVLAFHKILILAIQRGYLPFELKVDAEVELFLANRQMRRSEPREWLKRRHLPYFRG